MHRMPDYPDVNVSCAIRIEAKIPSMDNAVHHARKRRKRKRWKRKTVILAYFQQPDLTKIWYDDL